MNLKVSFSWFYCLLWWVFI